MNTDFKIEIDGKTYECSTVISGTRTLSQTIYVKGIGAKKDGASYSNNSTHGHSIKSMQAVANLIAMEIISESSHSTKPKT